MESSAESEMRLRKSAPKPIETGRYRFAGEEAIVRAAADQSFHQTAASDEESCGEPLSPSSRLFHEPTFNVHVIAIMGSKTKIDPQVCRKNLVHTLLKHPRFSSLQVEDEKKPGQMKWIRTKVNLDHHIMIPEVNPNIDSPDKFVGDYIYNLSKTTLDKTKPLWDLHLLNVKTSDAEAIGIFRIHHSLGDGTSLMSLLLACTRQIANPDQLPTLPVKKNDGEGSRKSNMWRRFTSSVLRLMRLFWNTLVDVLMFVATAMFLKDTPTPMKGLEGSEFNPRRIVYRTVSLDDIKFVKNAMNMTINDVALGITQRSLALYLNRRYAQGNQSEEGATEKKNNLPKNIRLRSTLLINIRQSAGIQALADMMDKDTEAKWGNWIGYVLLPFTIALRDDPLDYVRDAKAAIDRKKNSFEALYTFLVAEIVLKLFGIKMASRLSHKIMTNTTMCFSNLVGPQEEIGFYGHSMAFLAPSSYGQPHALMINFQSYINKMTVVLSVDESCIPDPHKILDDIEDSLKVIKEATMALDRSVMMQT